MRKTWRVLATIAALGCWGCGSSTTRSGSGPAATAELTVLHAFHGDDGAWSRGSLARVGDMLYGRTAVGGAANAGTIFRIATDGSAFESLYAFTAGGDNRLGNQPHHNAMLLDGSTLIGAALYGGNTAGPSSDALLTGPKPAGPPTVQTGNGTLFAIDTDGGHYRVLAELDGAPAPSHPHSPPIPGPDGMLYGLTSNGGVHDDGTLYRLAASGDDLVVLHSFEKATGNQPHGVLTFDSTGTSLLGMTRKHGTPVDPNASGAGVVFRYEVATGAYTVLHTFVAGSTADGDTNDHGFLTLVGRRAYAVTQLGGSAGQGTLFAIDEDGANFAVLHSFGATASDGREPYGSLVPLDGWLYGTTTGGGATGDGTLFRFHPGDGTYQLLASFDRATTGAFPEDDVVPSADGRKLFGLTQAGGVHDPDATAYYGTVFAFPVP